MTTLSPVFGKGEVPEDMAEIDLAAIDGGLGIADIMRASGMTASNSEGFRLIGQGAVRVDGEKVSDRGLILDAGGPYVVQVGKRKFARVTLTSQS